ncbi:DUF294 nucleotidyltransferase-like domain-containing protein [Accumulibacter sp.]|uniref:DUF294 nucleotidyltransferase-like domain-containing protein n=1 Tax=Accumulibacter sp. TaxID=2053492 RepID=UPI0025FF6500|nr:DUF294 nucleotidyltransferase-like domain-containing protein [Accumulibacter sp.]MCM8626933.1 DUF294 nucleotidyltransferase-like domain-containing protein [Accumulibacter sp.]
MHDELAEVRDFLAQCPPFDSLDPDGLAALTRRFVIRYLRRGASFPPEGQPCLWLVRQGAVELRTVDGELARRMAEGDVHDAACLPDSPEIGWAGHAVEDTLVYGLPRGDLERLWEEHPDFRQQSLSKLVERLRRARRRSEAAVERDLGSLPLASLIGRAPVCASPAATIREAATQMTRERVSALLVVDRDRLCGIVTDRDLRSRCLASGLPDRTPLSVIMTPDPCTLPPDAAGFDAVLTMTRKGIHHLPVVDGQQLLGLVSSTDLLRAQRISSVHLADRIHRATDLAELVVRCAELPELWLNLVRRGEGAVVLGRVVSGIADALASRLLVLAERRLGPPPVGYAWIAFGSQGRHELSLNSDQDNALVLADEFEPEQHAAYFTRLAHEVCGGLAACGIQPCSGEMMATNPQWRQPVAAWSRLFGDWIDHPDPHKARLASNLFDFRTVHGDDQLTAPLREQIARRCTQHQTLLAHLVVNTCAAPPPLGFFRQFVVIGDGEHQGELDIKRHGLLQIVDLARIHALGNGIRETGTVGRLRTAEGTRLLSREGAETLAAAFEFLLGLRTRHQQEQIGKGLRPDNFVAPATLGAAERHHLRDVFVAVARQQKALLLAFPHAARS